MCEQEKIELVINNQESLLADKTDIFCNLELATFLKDKYQNASPFPHIVIDNMFSDTLLEFIVSGWPKSAEDYKGWDIRNDEGIQVKLRSNWQSIHDIPIDVSIALELLNSRDFLLFLTELTGIKGLIPDMYYDGGGMNEIKKGGHLAIHCDGNKNIRTGLYRALNVIIYLNKDWKDEYNGHLNLYDKSLNLTHKIAPLFNRMVIFTTKENSYHGHPEPLNCPEDMSRKSLILYYYTRENLFNNDSVGDVAPHSAKFIPNEVQ